MSQKTPQEIHQFIEEYRQATDILDDLDKHTFEAELTLPQKVEQLEKDCIRTALYNNTITQAAKELGISRELLYYKIKKYQIKL